MAQFRLVGRIAWGAFEGTRQEAEQHFAPLFDDLVRNGVANCRLGSFGTVAELALVETSMPDLSGTVRQVAYALSVRHAMVAALNALEAYCERIDCLPPEAPFEDAEPPDIPDYNMVGNAAFPEIDDDLEIAAWIWCANAVKGEISDLNYAGAVLDYILPHMGAQGAEPARLIRFRSSAHGLRPRPEDLAGHPERGGRRIRRRRKGSQSSYVPEADPGPD